METTKCPPTVWQINCCSSTQWNTPQHFFFKEHTQRHGCDIPKDMDEVQMYYAKWKKPHTIMMPLIWHSEKSKTMKRNQINGCQGLEMRKVLTTKGNRENFRCDEIVLYFDCGCGYMTIWICQNSQDYIIKGLILLC